MSTLEDLGYDRFLKNNADSPTTEDAVSMSSNAGVSAIDTPPSVAANSAAQDVNQGTVIIRADHIEAGSINLQQGFTSLQLSSIPLPTDGLRIDFSGIYGRRAGVTTFSIDNYGALTATNVNITGRTIVIDNTADIQATINSLGVTGGVVHLKAGTYSIPAGGITMQSSTRLEGDSFKNTIIDFGGTGTGINVIGTDDYHTGTVTNVAADHVTVTGSGTTWTSIATPSTKQIFLGTRWYKILSVTNNTTLVLAEGYGDDVVVPAGITYIIGTVKQDISLTDITVTGSAGSGITFTNTRDTEFIDVYSTVNFGNGITFTNAMGITTERLTLVANALYGFSCTNSGYGQWQSIPSIANGWGTAYGWGPGGGFYLNNIKTIPWTSSAADANTGNGITMLNSQDVYIVAEAMGNTAIGFEMSSNNNDIVMIAGIISGNGSDGIKLTATTDNFKLGFSHIVNNGGYGINIAAATDDNTIVSSNDFSGNASGACIDSGTGTIIRGNSGLADNFTNSVGLTYFTVGENISIGNALSVSPGTTQTDSLGGSGTADTLSATTNWKSQKFTTPSALDAINSVTVRYGNSGGTSGHVFSTVSIRADSGGSPTGSDLVTANVDWVSTGADVTTAIYTFSSPYVLSPSTTYHLVFRVTSVTGSVSIAQIYVYRNNTGATGTNDSTDSGGTWSAINGALNTTYTYKLSTISMVYKSNSTNNDFKANGFIGFAQENAIIGNQVGVKLYGVDSNQSGLTTGATYYLQDVSGTIGSSAGSQSRKVGISVSPTEILIKNDNA